MRAMIFAAGLGTRLKPLTETMPKAMVPLNGKPLLQILLEKMRAAGIREVVVNVHHFAEQIIQFLLENDNFGLDIRISDERNLLLETGGGLRKAFDLFSNTDEPILVHNVDILSNLDFNLLEQMADADAIATLVVSARETQRYLVWKEQQLVGWRNIQTGDVKGDGDGDLFAFSGIQLIQPRLARLLQQWPEEKFSIINFYLAQMKNHPIKCYVPQDYRMMDVGKFAMLKDAEIFASSIK